MKHPVAPQFTLSDDETNRLVKYTTQRAFGSKVQISFQNSSQNVRMQGTSDLKRGWGKESTTENTL